jgi:L-threonylcarbamoyladenylate synthase
VDASPLVRRAARAVRAGGVIAYPTEAVFGLGCDPGCERAVRRILAIKGRPSRAGLILIAAELAQLQGWIAPTPAEQRRLVSRSARPVTWIVTAGPRATPSVTGRRDRIAVRLTMHPLASRLCRVAAMPLVSTSANRHRRPPARTALAVRRQLGSDVDFVLPGATGGWQRPSEIRDARSGTVLRRG